MAETKRPLDDFINVSTGTLKDNVAGDISAEDLRDFVVTAFDGLYSGAIDAADGVKTGVVGTMLVLDISGFTADRAFTLPVAANVTTGDRCGVMISTGDDTYELLLKSGASGDLINGFDHSTVPWARLGATGEVVIFRCINGTTGDWIVEEPPRTRDGRTLRAPNWITGIVPSWNSATTIDWSDGTAMVEGTLVKATSLTKTVTTAQAGLSAVGIWLHWLYDAGSGVAAIDYTQDDTTNAPTWDTTYGYWSRNGDPTYRLIGWHLVDTDSTRKIMHFVSVASGSNVLQTDCQTGSLAQNRITVNDVSASVTSLTALTYVDRATPANSKMCSALFELNLLIKFKFEDLENTTNIWSAELELHAKNQLPVVTTNPHLYSANLVRFTTEGAGVEDKFSFFPKTQITVTPLTTTIYYTMFIVTGAATLVDVLLDFVGGRMQR